MKMIVTGDALVQSLISQARSLRGLIRIGYLALIAACIAGAVCLYVAIADWLIGYPFRSAVFTVVAYFNGYNFCNSLDSLRNSRRQLKNVISLRRQLEATLRDLPARETKK